MSALARALVTVLLVALALIGTLGRLNAQREGRGPALPEVRGVVKSVDVGKGTISIGMAPRRGEPAAEDQTYPLAKDVEVAHGTSGRGRSGVYREGKVADLPVGAAVTLTLSADGKSVESILAEGPTVRGLLKTVDAEKQTVTLTLAQGRGEASAEEKTYALAKDVEIAADDGRGRRFSIKEAKPADLASGSLVTLWLSVDQKHVQAVLAEGPSVNGILKAVDAGKNSVTVLVGQGRGGQAGEERTLAVAPDAGVLVDDGMGRRLSVKEVKLADVPVGAAVLLKLSADQQLVMMVRAEGPSFAAHIKAVDPKGSVTFAIPVGRGENPEEKTLPVAKNVHIWIEGAASKLADIKVGDNGPFAVLRLSLDQKAIQAIVVNPSR